VVEQFAQAALRRISVWSGESRTAPKPVCSEADEKQGFSNLAPVV
jgi:hypothetical protein